MQSAAGLRCGRRGAFFGPDEDFNGFRAVSREIGLEEKMRTLFETTRDMVAPRRLEVVTAYFEIYGGAYPHPTVAAPRPKPKVVQSGVWYSPRIALAAYDIQLVFSTASTESSPGPEAGGSASSSGGGLPAPTSEASTAFLGFDDALVAAGTAGLLFIPAAFRGTLGDAIAWAFAHSQDNALEHFNPDGLPLIDGNAGEGFVVRTVTERVRADGARSLTKMKNPRFAEVAEGPSSKKDAAAAGTAATRAAVAVAALAARFLLPARIAAVVSKQSEAYVSLSNIKGLAALVAADAFAEEGCWSPEELASVAPGGPLAAAFIGAAMTVTRTFLIERQRLHAWGPAT